MATFSGASVGPLIGGIIADRLSAFLATGALISLSGLVILLAATLVVVKGVPSSTK